MLGDLLEYSQLVLGWTGGLLSDIHESGGTMGMEMFITAYGAVNGQPNLLEPIAKSA